MKKAYTEETSKIIKYNSMKLSMYSITVPEFKRSLSALRAILVKAEAFVAEKKIVFRGFLLWVFV